MFQYQQQSCLPPDAIRVIIIVAYFTDGEIKVVVKTVPKFGYVNILFILGTQ